MKSWVLMIIKKIYVFRGTKPNNWMTFIVFYTLINDNLNVHFIVMDGSISKIFIRNST